MMEVSASALVEDDAASSVNGVSGDGVWNPSSAVKRFAMVDGEQFGSIPVRLLLLLFEEIMCAVGCWVLGVGAFDS